MIVFRMEALSNESVSFFTLVRRGYSRLARFVLSYFYCRMDEMPPVGDKKKGSINVTHVWRAFRYSMAGIASAVKCEDAFKQELALAIIMIPVSFFIDVGWTMRTMMIVSVLLVLLVELLNSSIEAVVDYISTQRHPLAKKAKDMGSAAVFMSLVTCGFVWAVAILMCLGVIGR
jgi:diacylglycerol kinase (ATP)